MTEITKNEIQSNIREEILSSQNDINQFKKTIYNKGKILKNLETFKPYFALPKLDIYLDFKDLSKTLDHLIVYGKVCSIPYDKAYLKVIVTSYCKQLKKRNTNFLMQ